MAEHENKDHVSDTLEAGMDTAGDIANNAYNHYKDRQNAASGNTPQRNNSSGDSTKSKDSTRNTIMLILPYIKKQMKLISDRMGPDTGSVI